MNLSLSQRQNHAQEKPGSGQAERFRPAETVQIKSKNQSRGNLFLDLPIAGRLALGFMLAALVAALAAGLVGVERSQALGKQTDFYHRLLQINTSLTTGRSFLELMSSKLHQTLDDANAPNPSRETLAGDNKALTNLAALYTQTLNTYVQQDMLNQHPDQMALLNEASAGVLAQQQLNLTVSAQRTWQFYQSSQQDFLKYIGGADVKNAQRVLQQQSEPTMSDALSALHSLIQLNDRLASVVDDATNIEIHNELLTTVLATGGAFLLIVLVGWFISDTLVRRLRHLQRVTRAVEEGRINERVQVMGRDEIADVSLSVNAMIDTIVGLLEETRQQRDALTGAAEHLFTDMRVVNAGDLRISATVSNDPIGMLANAFNFTVGRFRRFLLHTQTTVEQLEVVARQSRERSTSFIGLARMQMRELSTSGPRSSPPTSSTSSTSSGPLAKSGSTARKTGSLSPEPNKLFGETRDDLNARLATTHELVEKAGFSLNRLNELISARPGTRNVAITEKMVQAQLRELVMLEQLLRRLSQNVQQTRLNVTSNFTRLDAAVAELARATAESVRLSAPADVEAPPVITEAQYEEFVRQAGSFAVEINALSKRLAMIIREMRAGIVPFRLEGEGSLGEFIPGAERPGGEPVGFTG